jgi:hypothetical protein
MEFLDRLCAATLFVAAMANGLVVPRTYAGRIWIFGTCLALLFAAMLNLLRIRNRPAVSGLKLFCFAANVIMLVFGIALMASIGPSRSVHNPQLPVLTALLMVESVFSLGKNA